MIYRHKNSELHTDDNGRSKFYINGGLRFMGDPYSAMKMFIDASNNHPEVLKMFQKQLEQREKPKFTRSEKKAQEEPPEPPKPKPKVKSERRSRIGMSNFRMTR